jgi:hypothetical protein
VGDRLDQRALGDRLVVDGQISRARRAALEGGGDRAPGVVDVHAADVVAAPPHHARAAVPQRPLERAVRPVDEAEGDQDHVETVLRAQGEQAPRDVDVPRSDRRRALGGALVDPGRSVVAPGERAADVDEPRAADKRLGGQPGRAAGLLAAVGGQAAVGQPAGRHRRRALDDRVDRLAGGEEPVPGDVQLTYDRGLQEARSPGDVHPAEPQIVHRDRR